MKKLYQTPISEIVELTYIENVLLITSTETEKTQAGEGTPDDARFYIIIKNINVWENDDDDEETE
jgi:hypothetical protein